jgi:uncharacterized protein (DUF2235 family)
MGESATGAQQATTNETSAGAFPDKPPSSTQPCDRKLILGLFFDGTGNNKTRDALKGGETNVARLHQLWRTTADASSLRAKLYVPGVGSMTRAAAMDLEMQQTNPEDRADAVKFNESQGYKSGRVPRGSDPTSDISGKAFGAGAHARIAYAYTWTLSQCKRVCAAAEKIIDVYGFSRGAAMARTFINLVNQALKKKIPNVTVRFVGLFDTVSSSGINDSDPGQNTGIDKSDAKVIKHYSARDEHRAHFPLSEVDGVPATPYAGVHSDVGGGYATGEDGKSTGLAYVPLRDMYKASVEAGVDMDPVKNAKGPSDAELETIRKGSAAPAGSPEAEDIQSKYQHDSINNFSPANHGDFSGHRTILHPVKKKLAREPPDYSWEDPNQAANDQAALDDMKNHD